jgi:IgGFc binding protein
LSFAERTGGDTYRILTTNDGITLYTNGVPSGTLHTGVPLETNIDGPVEFSASKPIQVAHFGNGILFDHAPYGDPCEIILPATNRYSLTNTVVTPVGDFTNNSVNIIVARTAISNTFVDGSLISSSAFGPIGNGNYYGVRFTITSPGPHTIVSSQPAGVEAYGWGNADAYGYFGVLAK